MTAEQQLEALLSDADATERWLVQKNRLDFGPFAMAQVKRLLYQGELGGDDLIIDQDTGSRCIIRAHPALRDFVIQVEQHLAVQRSHQAEQKAQQQDRKRKTMLTGLLATALIVLAAGGVFAAYMLTRDPQVREKVIYKEKAGTDSDLINIKGIEVAWQPEPPEQAKQRKSAQGRNNRNRKRAGRHDDDVTRLGDATEGGGDALLSQKVVQQVMQSNLNRLTRCVLQEARRDSSLKHVAIDFGVQGSGRVSSVKVNDKTSGSFHSCVASEMEKIAFPPFDGALTRARFTMNLKY